LISTAVTWVRVPSVGRERKIAVRPGPRTPSNFPRRNTTPRSYYRSTRSDTLR
jgi:hypothetical protein